MHYSTINVFPQNIVTTDKEKIQQFNKIAEYIRGERKNLDPKLKPIYDKVTKYADEKDKKDFTFRLNEDGQLITKEDKNIQHIELVQGTEVYNTYYATMLANLLSEFTEYPLIIEFFLDDLHWGFYINPETKSYRYLASFLTETNNNRITIYNPTGIQKYILFKKEKYSKLEKTEKKPDRRLIFG